MATTTTSTTPSYNSNPQPSALQTLLCTSTTSTKDDDNNDNDNDQTTPPPKQHPAYLINLAHQVSQNLQHQHQWTSLEIHLTTSPTSSPSSISSPSLLPRPLISGTPPQRLYIHPDEQIALLQAQKAKAGASKGLGHVKVEREWVCPSHLREKWSLRRFAEVFGGIGVVPPAASVSLLEGGDDDDGEDDEEEEVNKWRTTKRIVLATVDDDSTIVYYIVHDGIVKPRQN